MDAYGVAFDGKCTTQTNQSPSTTALQHNYYHNDYRPVASNHETDDEVTIDGREADREIYRCKDFYEQIPSI